MTLLIVENNNHLTKLVNVYIVSDSWPRNLLNTFTLKNCLFGATNITKNNDKSNYKYSDYGIVFDGKGTWSFRNDFDRNVGISAVDNSSSCTIAKSIFEC